ncbi:predicted protein [Botrytis cinerea T4]|uniref:Uncharacterized protein n=1 Tax=Botryotinia fuckeliana (strain T4) TaxID=999810 RepID=G2Y355_BOTF4|nr:predicted protein [Botrytis cinerea T4]
MIPSRLINGQIESDVEQCSIKHPVSPCMLTGAKISHSSACFPEMAFNSQQKLYVTSMIRYVFGSDCISPLVIRHEYTPAAFKSLTLSEQSINPQTVNLRLFPETLLD